ncbi:MAG: hypothetical protein R3F62_07860 [Planctomycetota bacterium]
MSATGEVKLTDFGLALRSDVSERLTREGAVLGHRAVPGGPARRGWTPAG